ncbi:hypothetical protein ACTXGK_10875 [Psychrobacter sp. T6-5]
MTTHTEEEMEALAAELLEVDLELPIVCPTCGAEMENKHGHN